MLELERKEIELEIEERRRMEIKKNLINDAAKKQDEPVDDSKLVEAMFDFLPDSSSEAPVPTRETSVFMVCITCAYCTNLFDNIIFLLNEK
jgi:myosin-7